MSLSKLKPLGIMALVAVLVLLVKERTTVLDWIHPKAK